MSWLKDFFKPRQDNFTRLLIEQAAWVVKGLDALSAYMVASEARHRPAKSGEAKAGDAKAGDAKVEAKPGDGGKISTARAVEAVQRCEEEADEVRRILISELNRTFVTPMDREDIFALSRAIDDILDYAWSTVQEMELLHVTPTPYVHRMVSLLGEAAHEVHMAMLRIKDHPEVATEHAQRAKALENRVEHVYREALADLFDGPAGPKRVIWILKMREIYRHLSNAADRGDAAANIIYDIVVKMT
ncbi:MAG: DUF47 domain-containing protein [Anaerolineae bacterium]